MEHTGLSDRASFKKVYVDPLIASGKLRMTDPDTPTSRNQRYVTAKLFDDSDF